MLEPLLMLGAMAVGLVAYSLLMGRRLIAEQDRQVPDGENAEQGGASKERLGACCGFGLPLDEQREPVRARET